MGGVVADAVAPPGAPRLDPATLGLLAALLAGDWEAAELADDRARSQASGVVAAYTQFHLERKLRSLEHVDRRRTEPRAGRHDEAEPAAEPQEQPPAAEQAQEQIQEQGSPA